MIFKGETRTFVGFGLYEISLKFLFSQEFGCNYESLNGEEVFKYVLLYELSVQLSAVNSDFQAILQGKMKDMKERKSAILEHNERIVRKEN